MKAAGRPFSQGDGLMPLTKDGMLFRVSVHDGSVVLQHASRGGSFVALLASLTPAEARAMADKLTLAADSLPAV